MHSLDVLEFEFIRTTLAEFCETELGLGLAKSLAPSWDAELVWENQARAREADRLFTAGVPSLAGIRDLRSDWRLASKGRVLDGVALWRTGRTILILDRFKSICNERLDEDSCLNELAGALPSLADLGYRLDSSLDGDGELLDSASSELARLRASATQLARNALDAVQRYISGRQRDLLSDPLYTQRNGRYVIPLKAEHRGKIKGIVHDSSASGQTIYLEPEDVVAITNRQREAVSLAKAEEERILAELSALVGEEFRSLTDGVEAGGQFDELLARAKLKAEWRGSWVEKANKEAFLKIQNARHPVLDRDSAVPLSLELGGEHQGVLITGPNTGGKTVSIRTVGLVVAMAQAGLPVPAPYVELGVFSQIWADIGDEQSVQQSLSTFSGHIKNLSEALKGMKRGCLVLVDEIGAGTDPGEGAALAQALLTEFKKRGAVILASSHYGELKLYASNEPGFINASMEFDLKSLRPTYRFMLGTPGSSHAFKIASRYGIPDGVILQAESGFSQQEKDVSRMIEELEAAQKRARTAQSEADRLAARLRKVEAEADDKLAAAEETRVKVRRRMADELDELLRQIRIESAEIFEEVKRNPNQQGIDRARKKLAELQDVGKDFSKDLRPKEKKEPVAKKQDLRKGMRVRVLGLNLEGVILEEPRSKKVSVQAGMMRMDVALNQLVALGMTEVPLQKAKKRSANLVADKALTAQREIHLRQYRAEDAKEELEKFIDDCLLAGMTRVRIVHGKGEGVLRKVVREFLRTHSGVAGFTDGDAEEGGQGVTIAEFK